MQKIDFKKDFKQLYKAPEKDVVFVEVPPIRYLMVDGQGDPNTVPEFQTAVETLYGTAYTIKFSLKKAAIGPEYTVPPLEGLWWCEGMEGFDKERKDLWCWTLMIPQPAHISEEILTSALSEMAAKGKAVSPGRIRLETLEEGLCVQTMHVGPYTDEEPTLEAMHRLAAEKGYSLRGRHHEVYLSDPRRTSPEKLKTILRHPVKN